MNQETTNLDYDKIAALQQKRTLAFVNHFVITTVQILNNFMKKCEQRLMHFQRKLEKVEAAVVLLEARLSSIPEINVETQTEAQINNSEDVVDLKTTDPEETTREAEKQNDNIATSSEDNSTDPQLYPEYGRFVKMVQVGVPLQAVKLKVSLEGLDPNILEKVLNK